MGKVRAHLCPVQCSPGLTEHLVIPVSREGPGNHLYCMACYSESHPATDSKIAQRVEAIPPATEGRSDAELHLVGVKDGPWLLDVLKFLSHCH